MPFSNSTCCSVSQANGRTTEDPVYTVNDYTGDGGRMWMNAKAPFTVYSDHAVVGLRVNLINNSIS